ncbi:MAG: glutamate synthase [Chloroflexi bacterium]|nr:glutamate synthase [Chloroflexota bacterium]
MRPTDITRHVRARILEPDVAVTTHDEVQATYTLEQAQAEVRRAIDAGFDLDAASAGCPFKVDIPAYFQKIAEGDVDGALAIIRRSHPFPSIFGRMCHMFCQEATPPLEDVGVPWEEWRPPEWDLAPEYGAERGWNARRGTPPVTDGEPVRSDAEPAAKPRLGWSAVAGTIRGAGHGSGIPGGRGIERPAFLLLERFAGDYGDPALSPVVAERPTSGKRVAVIGAGSGGLANAWMLRRLGHDVDIYDQLSVPGGTLFAGYPAHRMAKFGVRRDNDPTSWGARFFGGRRLNKADMEAIIAEYDLTFLSVGEFDPRMVGIPGEDAIGVWNALFFIAEVGYGRTPVEGGRCIILGAGHTATDTAHVARRLGCDIKIFYRRGLDEMPIDDADPREYVNRMSEDGIEYHFLAQPVRILADEANRVRGVEFVRTRLGEPDASGRRSPHPVPGSNFVIDCEVVVEAVGESIDPASIPDSVETEDGLVRVDRHDHRTSNPKVFAGGDVIGDRGNDGAALAGIQAALTMDSVLRAEPIVLSDGRALR